MCKCKRYLYMFPFPRFEPHAICISCMSLGNLVDAVYRCCVMLLHFNLRSFPALVYACHVGRAAIRCVWLIYFPFGSMKCCSSTDCVRTPLRNFIFCTLHEGKLRATADALLNLGSSWAQRNMSGHGPHNAEARISQGKMDGSCRVLKELIIYCGCI